MKRQADQPAENEPNAKRNKSDEIIMPWMPMEIWQNIVVQLFDSYLIEERIWRENILTFLKERAADPNNTGPAFHLPEYNPNQAIESIVRASQYTEPWSPQEDPRVQTKSVILRQQEVYGLIFKLSVTSRDFGCLVQDEKIWKKVLELTLGAKKWLETNPHAIEKEFSGSYKLACKFLMIFGRLQNPLEVQDINLHNTMGSYSIMNNTVIFYDDELKTMDLDTQIIKKENYWTTRDNHTGTYTPTPYLTVMESRGEDNNETCLNCWDNRNTGATWELEWPAGTRYIGNCEDITLVGADENGYHFYVCQSFEETGEDVFFDNSFQKIANGAPYLLGELPVLLWFTSDTLEVFIIDGAAKRVKQCLSINVFDTKGFNFEDSLEYGCRTICLDSMHGELREYNPVTLKNLARLPIKLALNLDANNIVDFNSSFEILGNFCFIKQANGNTTKWCVWDLKTGKQVNTWSFNVPFKGRSIFAGTKLYYLLEAHIVAYKFEDLK